jgi:hypothetical protein
LPLECERTRLGCQEGAALVLVRAAATRASLRPAVRAELPPLQTTRLPDQLRERIRFLHYGRRTEETYVHWCRAFVHFQGLRHSRELEHIEAF